MTGVSPDSLRELAALLRSGLTLRQALVRWPDETRTEEVGDIARRVKLGSPVVPALAGSPYDRVLRVAFALHLSHGVDLALWLDDAARRVEDDLAASHSARAASAGAVLSGRMVAGLPLLFVPMVPMSRSGFTDATGMAILILGVVLACAGLRWIGRLVPSPPPVDPVAQLCGSVAALLDAGLGLPEALRAAAGGLGHQGRDACRLARLGWPWHEALARVDPAFEPVRTAIDQSSRHGLPVASTLRSLERRRRDEALREFDRRLKRAPVLMVVPLTCCVLPAYGLLGVAPFLRSMSLG